MIGIFMIINERGDCIINRNFDNLQEKGIAEIFLQIKRELGQCCSPIVDVDHRKFVFITRNKLDFIYQVTNFNCSLSVYIDLLENFILLLTGFIGVLSEDNIRKNFLLVNEIVEEIYNNGFPTTFDTEELSQLVFSDIETEKIIPLSNFFSNVIPAAQKLGITNINKSIFKLSTNNEHTNFSHGRKTIPSEIAKTPISQQMNSDIFIDVIDKIDFLIDLNTGYIDNLYLIGFIRLKNFIKTPINLVLGLSPTIYVNNPHYQFSKKNEKNAIKLDDIMFDHSVDYSEFAKNKTISFEPSQGEIIVLSYRTKIDTAPFTINANCKILSNENIQLSVNIVHLNESPIIGNITINFQVFPWFTDISGKTFEELNKNANDFDVFSNVIDKNKDETKYNQSNISISNNKDFFTYTINNWQLKKRFTTNKNGFEAKFKINKNKAPKPLIKALETEDAEKVKKYIGVFNVSFDFLMHSTSKVQIKYVKILNNYMNPHKWIRYVTYNGTCSASFR